MPNLGGCQCSTVVLYLFIIFNPKFDDVCFFYFLFWHDVSVFQEGCVCFYAHTVCDKMKWKQSSGRHSVINCYGLLLPWRPDIMHKTNQIVLIRRESSVNGSVLVKHIYNAELFKNQSEKDWAVMSFRWMTSSDSSYHDINIRHQSLWV